MDETYGTYVHDAGFDIHGYDDDTDHDTDDDTEDDIHDNTNDDTDDDADDGGRGEVSGGRSQGNSHVHRWTWGRFRVIALGLKGLGLWLGGR